MYFDTITILVICVNKEKMKGRGKQSVSGHMSLIEFIFLVLENNFAN